MSSGMLSLGLAMLYFLGIHFGISSSGVRPRLVARLGERGYRALFSLLSAVGLIWMAMAYGRAEIEMLWNFGAAGRYAAQPMMLAAFYLAVAGVSTPNPTAVGAEALLARGEAARGIQKVTRHPVMWGVALWAIAHLLANGHLAALILFGGLGFLALVGPHLIDAKLARRGGEAWRRYAAETSWLPFRAIAAGRARLRLGQLGWGRPALALALYLAMLLWLHNWLIGVPLATR